MKSIKMPCKIFAGTLFFLTFFLSCQKESITKPLVQQPAAIEDEDAVFLKTVDALGVTKVILKPNAKDGQDTYVTFWNGDASWANSTGDWAQELSMDSWTNGGLQMGVRSYLRFDKIALIPADAQIISAKLFLYAKGSSISNPNGNSGYSGSPYNTDNACKIERVTGGTWDEATLTWNTQPAVTTADAAIIPASNSQWAYNTKVDVTNMVKAMAADPSKNYGFRISLVNENIYRSMIFASSENTNPKLRPKLVIQLQ
ncbi:DNRLRE domain-containing protein [Panacibacter ginsenosidivorans]|uniref:DNRLRE domain-containing protein n=1 Tax=Panacibacter ginsenosidivorans TaxID=1813871 RepID=A0A5B8V442_9BACT|nr:DNRLRE domain-containing protein [Panacibacter ginsenosidivorans]QEC65948.1 DNRLRE domain-containing protein [Panacibacter ginsenosidivorans]